MEGDLRAVDVLLRCVRGELSPAVALVRLLIAYGDVAALQAGLVRAGSTNREGGIRDAVERVEGLLTSHPQSSALVLNMLQIERVAAGPDEAVDEVERCRSLFDRLVGENAPASVALYSLGDSELLDAATREVVKLLDHLAVLGPERHVLEIGCGIGRFEQALAPRVAAITGIDLAPGMIKTARKRCAGLPNVTLVETSGRDLAAFPPGSFDTVLAIDAMPYVWRAGAALVVSHFAEVARVLRAGGDWVILHLSYRGDLGLDREDARRLAEAVGLRVLRNGTTDLRLWDGATFHLRKPGVGATGATISRSG
jgi:SAM-dependent methyltransferase